MPSWNMRKTLGKDVMILCLYSIGLIKLLLTSHVFFSLWWGVARHLSAEPLWTSLNWKRRALRTDHGLVYFNLPVKAKKSARITFVRIGPPSLKFPIDLSRRSLSFGSFLIRCREISSNNLYHPHEPSRMTVWLRVNECPLMVPIVSRLLLPLPVCSAWEMDFEPRRKVQFFWASKSPHTLSVNCAINS